MLLRIELLAIVLVNHVWQMVVGVLVKCYKPRDLRDLRLSTLVVVGESWGGLPYMLTGSCIGPLVGAGD
jgi:hypothetical protein